MEGKESGQTDEEQSSQKNGFHAEGKPPQHHDSQKEAAGKDEIELADLPKAVVKTSDNGLSLAIKRIVKHGNIAVDKDHLSDHLARRSDIHNHKGEGQEPQEDGIGQFKRPQIVAEGLQSDQNYHERQNPVPHLLIEDFFVAVK